MGGRPVSPAHGGATKVAPSTLEPRSTAQTSAHAPWTRPPATSDAETVLLSVVPTASGVEQARVNGSPIGFLQSTATGYLAYPSRREGGEARETRIQVLLQLLDAAPPEPPERMKNPDVVTLVPGGGARHHQDC